MSNSIQQQATISLALYKLFGSQAVTSADLISFALTMPNTNHQTLTFCYPDAVVIPPQVIRFAQNKRGHIESLTLALTKTYHNIGIPVPPLVISDDIPIDSTFAMVLPLFFSHVAQEVASTPLMLALIQLSDLFAVTFPSVSNKTATFKVDPLFTSQIWQKRMSISILVDSPPLEEQKLNHKDIAALRNELPDRLSVADFLINPKTNIQSQMIVSALTLLRDRGERVGEINRQTLKILETINDICVLSELQALLSPEEINARYIANATTFMDGKMSRIIFLAPK